MLRIRLAIVFGKLYMEQNKGFCGSLDKGCRGILEIAVSYRHSHLSICHTGGSLGLGNI